MSAYAANLPGVDDVGRHGPARLVTDSLQTARWRVPVVTGMRSFLFLLIAACTATTADRPAPSDQPTPIATAPTAAKSVAPKLAASFDTALLCTEIPATGALLGDPTFGMTESYPPAPSVVGAVTYSFGKVPEMRVAGMRAVLGALGDVDFAGARIAADASLDDIAALKLAGCGDVQHNDGGDVIECVAGDVTVIFASGGVVPKPVPNSVQVSARSTACS